MADKLPPETQFTPRGKEIPIPTREEFAGNLDKLVKAPPPPKRELSGRRAARPKNE
jgi:hypothetical protein